MYSKNKKPQTNFNRATSAAGNRRKRMRKNNIQTILWRQRTFTIREFANIDENY